MDELIHVKNTSYARYEELLLRRDDIKKQAFHWEHEYMRVFGDRILKIFELKITCIRKKKTITYCQAILNYGKEVNQEELINYLDEQMAQYEKQLEIMIKSNDALKQTSELSESDALAIKKIYRRLAKMLHPDINPLTNENEELMDLWQRIIIAYNCNNLKELTETEVLVTAALKRLNSGTVEVVIPNIEEKIAELEHEILKIRETDPYLYKDILTNEEKVAEKNASLDEEYNSYLEYEQQLDIIIDGLISNGVKITWRMS